MKLPAYTVATYSIAGEPNSIEADLEPYLDTALLRAASEYRISRALERYTKITKTSFVGPDD
jgi:hypothetical protein